MTRVTRAAVLLAARTLPASIRDRYREEWLGDLGAASAEGIRESSVAVGALLFSATLDRDAPQLSGVPLSAAAARHARSAIAYGGVGAVLLFGLWINAQVSQHSQATLIGSIVASSLAVWRVLALAAAVASIVALWRAARITSTLARIAAALGTTGILSVVLGVAFPASFGPLALTAAVLLLGAAVCGSIVWSSAPVPLAAPVVTPAPVPRVRIRGRLVILLSVGAAVTLAFGLLMPSLMVVGIAILSVGSAAAASVWVMRRRLVAPRTAQPSPWWTVALGSIALFALVAVGTLDLLVWTPLAMAPGYSLTQIYDALSPQDRASGIVAALIWTCFWALVAVAYLVVGVVSARRPQPGTRRTLVLIAAAIVAVAVFLQWFAGFSLGNSISDTLPPFSGARTGFSALLGLAGQACLCLVILGWVRQPRPAMQPVVSA